MQSLSSTLLIAPCGINCGVCRAHLRAKNKCHGCRADDSEKPKTRVTCRIKTCEEFKDEKARFCFQCRKFPCNDLRRLEKRYLTKYNVSVVENLEAIKNKGIKNFVKAEQEKWECTECSGTVCMHTGKCSSCEKKK